MGEDGEVTVRVVADVAQISADIHRLERDRYAIIRTSPGIVDVYFALAEPKPITVRPQTRDHYTSGHTWLTSHPDSVVKTLLDPHRIVADKSRGNRIVFYGRRYPDSPQVVVVEIKHARGIPHRVVTAFEMSEREVQRRARMEPLIWEAGGEG